MYSKWNSPSIAVAQADLLLIGTMKLIQLSNYLKYILTTGMNNLCMITWAKVHM